jgi:hypothetical protein
MKVMLANKELEEKNTQLTKTIELLESESQTQKK